MLLVSLPCHGGVEGEGRGEKGYGGGGEKNSGCLVMVDWKLTAKGGGLQNRRAGGLENRRVGELGDWRTGGLENRRIREQEDWRTGDG